MPSTNHNVREDTPLLDTDIEQGGSASASSLSPAQLAPIQDGNLKETLVAAFAAVSFLASSVAMFFVGGLLVVLTGISSLFLSPFAVFQQYKITQTIAMKETNVFFQGQLDLLKANNTRLSHQVGEMTASIDHLQNIKKTLGVVQAIRGNCLQELEDQLQKQREIASMTTSNVKNDIIGNLLEIAMHCDTNQDMQLSPEEVNTLMAHMEHIAGVDVREEKVRQLIAQKGRSVMSLMEVAKQALREDIPEQDKLFVYRT